MNVNMYGAMLFCAVISMTDLMAWSKAQRQVMTDVIAAIAKTERKRNGRIQTLQQTKKNNVQPDNALAKEKQFAEFERNLSEKVRSLSEAMVEKAEKQGKDVGNMILMPLDDDGHIAQILPHWDLEPDRKLILDFIAAYGNVAARLMGDAWTHERIGLIADINDITLRFR